MKPETNDTGAVGAPPLSALTLDADPALAREPRLLVDPRFLGVLHFELVQKLGSEQAACNLLQLGFLRGLRDARTLVRLGQRCDPLFATAPVAPLLALRLGHRRGESGRGPSIQGSWPDQPEVEARLSTLGPAPHPTCWASAGYASGWLSGLHDMDLLALETRCAASGDPACRFVARTPESWRALGDPAAREFLRSLPFEDLRRVVDVDLEESAAMFDPDGLGGESPAVHVWGPVMILPFSGADESLRAVDLIGNDPEARAVSVVVIDLGGVILDEAFGAVALERTLDAIDSWGAEAILTEVSPLSESVVADLDRRHLLVRKTLPEAITTAFQVVQTQQNPL